MAPRRRALRDHGDPGPLMAVMRAALREASETRQRAGDGLAAHLRPDPELRILPAAHSRDTAPDENR